MNTRSTAAASTTANKKTSASRQGTKSTNALEKFFMDGLKDIYWAEKALVKTLPKMRKAATSTALQSAISDHLEVTQTHVSRLEEVFELMEHKAQAKKCDAMEGLIKEGESIIEETEAGTSTRDVGIIMAAQKVEHYEIATYGGLAQLAKTLQLDDVSALLEETLAEEKEADATLTGIAENDINYQASEEEEE
jgi:ferritin-like metal-binding protein YciE